MILKEIKYQLTKAQVNFIKSLPKKEMRTVKVCLEANGVSGMPNEERLDEEIK